MENQIAKLAEKIATALAKKLSDLSPEERLARLAAINSAVEESGVEVRFNQIEPVRDGDTVSTANGMSLRVDWPNSNN